MRVIYRIYNLKVNIHIILQVKLKIDPQIQKKTVYTTNLLFFKYLFMNNLQLVITTGICSAFI